MRTLLRDLGRQRLRTALTVLGVSLGIFTLVVLGALGEHFRTMVDEASGYSRGLLRLFTKTDAHGINQGITPQVLARVRAMPEVQVVEPTLILLLDGFNLQSDPLGFLLPKPLVEGLPASTAELIRGKGVQLLRGRWLRAGDDRQAMVVDWLAARRHLAVGGYVTIRHEPYRVVGVYHAPHTPQIPAGIVPYGPLNAAFMQPEIARAVHFFRSLAADSPLLAPREKAGDPGAHALAAVTALARRFAVQQGSLYRIYEIVPRDRSPAGTEALARKLRRALPQLAVIDPDTIAMRLRQAVAMFLVITLIVTVLSTVVGGLLIVNTMAMAVIERRKEIAIKAALGATPFQIAWEFVLEAATLSLGGAVLGIALGALAIQICEPYLLSMIQTGAHLFLITPRLVLGAASYAVAMGVLAGGIPAARAARIDPAVTLREM